MTSYQTHSSFLQAFFPGVRNNLKGREVVVFSGSWLKQKQTQFVKTLTSHFLSIVICLALVAAGVFLVPSLYYKVFPADVVITPSTEAGTAFGGSFENKTALSAELEPKEYEPPVDVSLPEGEWVIIPRIGVRTQPQATEQPEDALESGVWRVPDFGVPGEKTYYQDTDIKLPIILAAHRFGWEWWWQSDYWQYHSFYNLPETQPGDRIEIISGQRKWIYEIYAGEEGEEITDYSADLILYTCKFLNSPVRHFRYARLIDPTVNTQAVSIGQ